MFSDDRKVWARHLENTEATLEAIISWTTSEIKSRMRATAPLRNNRQLGSKGNVGNITDREKHYKCAKPPHIGRINVTFFLR